mmetsp:Transcript_43324/g.99842  ORF Transcript_43324/g.99842 Transcript_43324/m.99842 type:complete len:204 (+) Transcript_43324:89-700(+)
MRFLALMQSILCVLMLDRVLSKEGQFEMHRGLIHMDEDNMDAVLAHHEFTMVFFYRNCGKQCRLMERIFEKAAAELLDQDKVYCAKMFLEAVEHKHLQERFEVKLEPALTVIRHGKYHSEYNWERLMEDSVEERVADLLQYLRRIHSGHKKGVITSPHERQAIKRSPPEMKGEKFEELAEKLRVGYFSKLNPSGHDSARKSEI